MLQKLLHHYIQGFLDTHEKQFISYSRRKWKNDTNVEKKGEILVDLFPVASSVITYSYLSNILAEKFMTNIVSFTTYYTFRKRIVNMFRKYKFRKLFLSFGCKDHVNFKRNKEIGKKIDVVTNSIWRSITTKKDVLDIMVEDIRIGDLIYDSYLAEYGEPTIRLSSNKLKKTIQYALEVFFSVKKYFNSHSVRAVVLSHEVYINYGIITRIAIDRNIPVYVAHVLTVYFLSKSTPITSIEFLKYHTEFLKFSKESQTKAIAEAKKRLSMKLSGLAGIDMYYSEKSAYKNKIENAVLASNDKIKILIATHCFYDNPHGYQNMIFPDFYEWLCFLGEMSECTDYDWYLKTHPDYRPGTEEIIADIIMRYPKIKWLPANVSHHQLIEEGIAFALTVHGSIGHEYAALGVQVINAGQNPHIMYDFNWHAQTLDEYKQFIMNLKTLNKRIDLNEVYEFYFMHYMNSPGNGWLFEFFDDFLESIGGYFRQDSSLCYDYFINKTNDERAKKIEQTLRNFIDSDDYKLTGIHIPQDQVFKDT